MFLCCTVLPTWASRQATISSTSAVIAQVVDMIRNIDMVCTLALAITSDKTSSKVEYDQQ